MIGHGHWGEALVEYFPNDVDRPSIKGVASGKPVLVFPDGTEGEIPDVLRQIAEQRAAIPPTPRMISRAQFAQACAELGEISWQEAEDLASGQGLPPKLVAAMNKAVADANMRARARVKIKGVSTVDLEHPITDLIRQGMGWTPERLREVWRLAATL